MKNGLEKLRSLPERSRALLPYIWRAIGVDTVFDTTIMVAKTARRLGARIATFAEEMSSNFSVS